MKEIYLKIKKFRGKIIKKEKKENFREKNRNDESDMIKEHLYNN